MEFKIPCEVYARMSNACILVDNEKRMQLNVIRIEHVDGKCFVIATNAKVMAVQLIGEVDAPDGFVNVLRLPELIEQCEQEKAYDGELSIVVINELNFASAKTTFGYNYPGNVRYSFPENETDLRPWGKDGPNDPQGWRQVLPKEPLKKPSGFMFMNTAEITNLGKASPSQQLIFPSIIDANSPVIVRDKIDEDWMGVFLPQNEKYNKDINGAAVIPEWLK